MQSNTDTGCYLPRSMLFACPFSAHEESEDGLLLVRLEDNDELVGMTVLSWWERFGGRTFPDSIHELERAIEPWARKLAA